VKRQDLPPNPDRAARRPLPRRTRVQQLQPQDDQQPRADPRLARARLRTPRPDEIALDDLKQFLADHWRDAAVNTRISHVSDSRCSSSGRTTRLPRPRPRAQAPRPEAERHRAHARTAEPDPPNRRRADSRRDRIALLLLYWCALRRNELRQIQFRHIDLAAGPHRVRQRRHHARAEPPQRGRARARTATSSTRTPARRVPALPAEGRPAARSRSTVDEVVWEAPTRPLSMSGIDKWWQRCLRRAGVRTSRCTRCATRPAPTSTRSSHDLVATQHYMRHASAARPSASTSTSTETAPSPTCSAGWSTRSLRVKPNERSR
jgi:integrase